MDVLTDVLRALHLKASVHFEADFQAPWNMRIRSGAVRHFHLVTGGRCWVESEALDGARDLNPGDIIVFTEKARHILSDRPLSRGTFEAPASTPTTIVSGHFAYDRTAVHPLLSALPDVMHLRPLPGQDPTWATTAVRLALFEPSANRDAATSTQLAETLFVQILQAHLQRHPPRRNFFAALQDRGVSAALEAMHSAPDHEWSLVRLAELGGVSRSVFAERFKNLMGDSPMRYLTLWRMQKAKGMLVSGDLSIAKVAERVGYQSEFAFAKAFKRHYGTGPGSIRRAARAYAA